MIRSTMFTAVVVALGAFATACTAPVASAERRVPEITVSRPMKAPGWALKERELLDLNSRAARLWAEAYVLPNGHLAVDYEHGGGIHAPDDVFECIFKFPLLYALGADDVTWEVWWKTWRGSIEQCSAQGLFAGEFIKYLDWHHNAEHYEGFWLAGLCAPDDPEYRRQALKFAGFFGGANPRVPNYDPEHRVIRSMLTGGAGPVLNPTVEDWDERGGDFWREWLDCVHDGPVNLVTTCFGTNAFMLTGDDRYRKVTLQYIDAWRDRARRNGGIIPSIVLPDGTVPEEWWGGVMGWNFTGFGGDFQVTSGPKAAWANALLLTGDASYYDTMRTLADEQWKHRFKDKNGELDLPSHRGPDGWYGTERRNSGGQRLGCYASMLANIYLATMRREDLERILQRRVIQGVCGHGGHHQMNYYEGGYEPEWIVFLEGENPGWPERMLDISIQKVEEQIAGIKDQADAGPGKKREIATRAPWHAGYCGFLVNMMSGGVMPLWHGQLHLARFRYFDPERRRPGIPPDCAALVESLSDDSATLVLVNTSQTEAHTVLVQTGAYAEHRCLSVRPKGGGAVPVDGPLFAVKLPPGAGQRLIVRMERYANTPTLQLPWGKTL
jgi:hypothetical protein